MRITVPTLPVYPNLPPRPPTPPAAAIARLVDFLHAGASETGGVTVLTGAGVSVDSGVRAYRGSDGRYMNPNYK
jgi:NAD-dependent deacetylase sirtuin 4